MYKNHDKFLREILVVSLISIELFNGSAAPKQKISYSEGYYVEFATAFLIVSRTTIPSESIQQIGVYVLPIVLMYL